MIIQDVDEEVIQRRGSEAVPALGGEAIISCGEPGRQGSGAGASSVKMKTPPSGFLRSLKRWMRSFVKPCWLRSYPLLRRNVVGGGG